MPFPNQNQALATFLQIKRTQGLAAAKAWAKKHHNEMSAAMKGNHNAVGGKKSAPPGNLAPPYKARSKN